MNWLSKSENLSILSLIPDTSAFVYPVTLLESSGTFYVTDINNSEFSIGFVYTVDPTITQVTTNAISLVNGNIFSPCGMVIDSSYIYVTDYYGGSIAKVNKLDGSANLTWSETGTSSLFSIVGYGDHLYVSSYLNNVIIQIDFSGNVTDSSWCVLPSNGGQLVVRGSELFVACADGVYTVPLPSGGTPTLFIPYQLNTFSPTGLTILGNYLYVTDSSGTAISVYDSSSGDLLDLSWKDGIYGSVNLYNYNNVIYATTIGSIISFDPYIPNLFNEPIGMVEYNGTKYVSNYGANNIVTIDSSNIPQSIFLDTGLAGPIGMTVDTSGFMYIMNYDGGYVSKVQVSDTSNYISEWCTGFGEAWYSVLDGSGYLYVTHSYEDPSGNIPAIVKVPLNDPSGANFLWSTGYDYPSGLILHDGVMYVSDYQTSTIYTVSFLTGLKTPFITDIQAYDLVIHNNYLYTANENGSVSVYNFPSGTLVDASWNTGLGEIYGIFAYNDPIYVPSYDNDELYVFPEYTPVICYNKGTKILTNDGYVLVEDLKQGDLIKTYLHGYKPLESIKSAKMVNNLNEWSKCMYKLESLDPDYEDLIVTGGHGILKSTLTRREIMADHKWFKYNRKYSRIDSMYVQRAAFSPEFTRLMDNEVYTFYHFSLEGNRRYGVWANGVLSESTFLKDLKKI